MIVVGDDVFVPRARLGLDTNGPSALVRTKVQARHDRTLTVDVPGSGGQVRNVPSSAAHKDVGLYIITIGDYSTETSVLNPLTSSVSEYSRLLLPSEAVMQRFVRSKLEFEHYWNQDHGGYSHIIIVGHGGPGALQFAVDQHVSVDDFVTLMQGPNPSPKVIVSLCCQTGRKSFAAPVSSAPFCKAFIAPFHSVHGAVASEFTQVFFGQHFLGGRSIKVAFNKAGIEHPGKERFRFWQRGAMV